MLSTVNSRREFLKSVVAVPLAAIPVAALARPSRSYVTPEECRAFAERVGMVPDHDPHATLYVNGRPYGLGKRRLVQPRPSGPYRLERIHE